MPLGNPDSVDARQLRVAVHTHNGIEAPSAEIIETVERAAKALEARGVVVEEARPAVIDQTYEIYLGLFTADGGAGVESLLNAAGTKRVHPLMQRVLDLQRDGEKSVAELGDLIGRWDNFRSQMLAFMADYDAILCPVSSIAEMKHGSTYDRLPSFSYTMAFNLTGWPAAVVRAGSTDKGMPIGVQIAARPWREDVALSLAQALQDDLGGWQPPPL